MLETMQMQMHFRVIAFVHRQRQEDVRDFTQAGERE